MAKKDSITSYGFGQMGSAHGKTDASIYPPAGMVIVAVQFLEANIPTVMRQATEPNQQFQFFNTEFAANATANGTCTVANASGGVATYKAGDEITANTTAGIKQGDFILELTAAPGNTYDELVGGNEQAITGKAVKVERVIDGTKFTVDGTLKIKNGGTTLHFFSNHGAGYGGQDADGILYPKGMIVYGRWSEVKPQAVTNGGIICYFGY